MRTIRPDIRSITTYKPTRIELAENQYFCETPKTYELFDKSLDPDFGKPTKPGVQLLGLMIKRWPKSRIWAVNNEII